MFSPAGCRMDGIELQKCSNYAFPVGLNFMITDGNMCVLQAINGRYSNLFVGMGHGFKIIISNVETGHELGNSE